MAGCTPTLGFYAEAKDGLNSDPHLVWEALFCTISQSLPGMSTHYVEAGLELLILLNSGFTSLMLGQLHANRDL